MLHITMTTTQTIVIMLMNENLIKKALVQSGSLQFVQMSCISYRNVWFQEWMLFIKQSFGHLQSTPKSPYNDKIYQQSWGNCFDEEDVINLKRSLQ